MSTSFSAYNYMVLCAETQGLMHKNLCLICIKCVFTGATRDPGRLLRSLRPRLPSLSKSCATRDSIGSPHFPNHAPQGTRSAASQPASSAPFTVAFGPLAAGRATGASGLRSRPPGFESQLNAKSKTGRSLTCLFYLVRHKGLEPLTFATEKAFFDTYCNFNKHHKTVEKYAFLLHLYREISFNNF